MVQLMPLPPTISCLIGINVHVLLVFFLSSSPSKLRQQETLDNMPSDDDEHRLIARYTARLAADANNAVSCLNRIDCFYPYDTMLA